MKTGLISIALGLLSISSSGQLGTLQGQMPPTASFVITRGNDVLVVNVGAFPAPLPVKNHNIVLFTTGKDGETISGTPDAADIHTANARFAGRCRWHSKTSRYEIYVRVAFPNPKDNPTGTPVDFVPKTYYSVKVFTGGVNVFTRNMRSNGIQADPGMPPMMMNPADNPFGGIGFGPPITPPVNDKK